MVTSTTDDNRRQGEYRAICLWKMEWQSFAKSPDFKKQSISNSPEEDTPDVTVMIFVWGHQLGCKLHKVRREKVGGSERGRRD